VDFLFIVQHVAVDSTCKLNWNNFPVLLVGTTDYSRQFHPFGMAVTTNEEESDFEFIFKAVKKCSEALDLQFDPTILVADAAASITNGFKSVFPGFTKRVVCWAHVIRNLDTRLRSVKTHETRQAIRVDISILQCSSTPSIFKKSLALFLAKWRICAQPEVQTFIEYFDSQWCIEANSGWYHGYPIGIPCNDAYRYDFF
jgi:hypothetical protein